MKLYTITSPTGARVSVSAPSPVAAATLGREALGLACDAEVQVSAAPRPPGIKRAPLRYYGVGLPVVPQRIVGIG